MQDSPAMATNRKNIHVSMSMPARRSWKLLAADASLSITLQDASLAVVSFRRVASGQSSPGRSWSNRLAASHGMHPLSAYASNTKSAARPAVKSSSTVAAGLARVASPHQRAGTRPDPVLRFLATPSRVPRDSLTTLPRSRLASLERPSVGGGGTTVPGQGAASRVSAPIRSDFWSGASSRPLATRTARCSFCRQHVSSAGDGPGETVSRTVT